MKIPPPLSWLTEYTQSIERATGIPILLDLNRTVNPLVYEVTLSWAEEPSGAVALGAWNIFQMWANKNDSVPSGQVRRTPRKMTYCIIIKRRFGPNREDTP